MTAHPAEHVEGLTQREVYQKKKTVKHLTQDQIVLPESIGIRTALVGES